MAEGYPRRWTEPAAIAAVAAEDHPVASGPQLANRYQSALFETITPLGFLTALEQTLRQNSKFH